jgi:hypothetical protein
MCKHKLYNTILHRRNYFDGYSHSTSTTTHNQHLQLLTIHFYGYSQYTSLVATHSPRLLRLLTFNFFYGYTQSTSTATHNNFLQRLLIIHFFTATNNRFYDYSHSASMTTHDQILRLLTIRLLNNYP